MVFCVPPGQAVYILGNLPLDFLWAFNVQMVKSGRILPTKGKDTSDMALMSGNGRKVQIWSSISGGRNSISLESRV